MKIFDFVNKFRRHHYIANYWASIFRIEIQTVYGLNIMINVAERLYNSYIKHYKIKL